MSEKNTQAEAPSREAMGRLVLEASTGMHGDVAKQLAEQLCAALATQQAGQGEALSEDEITLLLADKIGFGDSDLQWCNRSDLVSVIRAVEARYSTTPPAPQQPEALAQQEREPLSEAEFRRVLNKLGPNVYDRVSLTYEYGPYDIDKPTNMAMRLLRAIEEAHGIRAARSSEGGQP